MIDLNLTGKDALVCGSTQGIGKSCAIELAQQGANITLLARNKNSLQEALRELDTTKDQIHHHLVADFSKPDEVKEVIDTYVANKQAIHILVNNTGGPAPSKAIDSSTTSFLEAFNAHLICNQHLTQAVVPRMKDERYGRIINIISTSVKAPIKGLGVSNTIRGAVASWAKTLSTELAEFGITVNNVLPGMTHTKRLEALIESRAKEANTTFEQMEKQMKQQIPAKRFASPEEIAAAVCFLASPAAGFVNGINLPVDGGSTPSL